MDDEELIEGCPRLFHVTETGAWPSIRRRGLLSTSALLDLFSLPEPLRSQIEAQPRLRDVVLADPHVGRVVIRDNRPLRPHILRSCLKGLVSDWCRLLNARVFFWASERRLRNHLRARGHRGQPRDIPVVDTRRLFARSIRVARCTQTLHGVARTASSQWMFTRSIATGLDRVRRKPSRRFAWPTG